MDDRHPPLPGSGSGVEAPRFERGNSLRKRDRLAGLVLAAGTLLPALGQVGCADADDTATAGRMELTGLVAYWGVRGKDSEGNTYIRPSVRFRVKNAASEEPVGYIQVMSVFRRESNLEEAWGTAYLHSVADESLAPGEESGEHTLIGDSNYLSQDTPERMFEHRLWEDVEVEMFLRVGASSWVSKGKTMALRRLGPPGVEKYLEPIEGEPIYMEAPRGDPQPAEESVSESPESDPS